MLVYIKSFTAFEHFIGAARRYHESLSHRYHRPLPRLPSHRYALLFGICGYELATLIMTSGALLAGCQQVKLRSSRDTRPFTLMRASKLCRLRKRKRKRGRNRRDVVSTAIDAT